jgi:hypothetical protein
MSAPAVGRLEAAALVLYAATVLLCTILVVGYGDLDLRGALIALTLPWSLVTLPFRWSLIHGASLWLFWLVYLGGGRGERSSCCTATCRGSTSGLRR